MFYGIYGDAHMILTAVAAIYILGAALIGYPIASASLRIWRKGWEAQPDKVGHGLFGFLIFPCSCWYDRVGDPRRPTAGLYLCEAHHCNEPAGELRYKRVTVLLWPLRIVANLVAILVVGVMAFHEGIGIYSPKHPIS